MSWAPLEKAAGPFGPAEETGLPPLGDLVERAADETPTRPGQAAARWQEFLHESSAAKALALWLGEAALRRRPTRRALARRLGRDIARLDALLTRQVNAILHHPRFQRLEASWRGLWFLTGQAELARQLADQDRAEAKVKIRMLDVSKRELARDLEKAVEFDQSQPFKKVYEDEFGTPGGEPYGVLIGDYEFAHRLEDVDLVAGMSEVAAAAFCPFVAAAAPELLGLDSFSTLEQPLHVAAAFDQLDYLKWRAFRDREEARFVGLTLPRVLMRLPYEDDPARADGFRFREEVERPDRGAYLWGSAAYAFASVLIRAFAASGWFADIRGVERGTIGGGLVTSLEVHSFSTDRPGVAPKTSTEVAIHDHQEKELGALGFIPLCHAKDTEFSAFYTNQSVQKPKTYDDPAATANAKISAMLQYVMCASRFAHYLKILARNKIGGAIGERELDAHLNRWIHDYVAADERAPQATKARFPLREARVEVREIPDKPGSFRLVMHLLPHFQLDELTATLKLVTRLAPASPG